MSTTYRIRPKLDVFVCLQMTLLYIAEIIDALNIIVNDVKVWCCKNHLTVHTGKTVAIVISSHAFIGPMRPLLFGNSYIITSYTNSTCLGVEIDYKLNWKPQVKALHTKFGGKLKFLNSLPQVY